MGNHSIISIQALLAVATAPQFCCLRAVFFIVLLFLIIPRAYLLFCLGSPFIFGYVTFHISMSIFFLYSFYCFSVT